MNKFDWNAFRKEKIAVEVLNDEECKEFLKECEKNNIHWVDKRATLFIPYTPTAIVCGFSRDDKLGYSRSKFFLGEGYKIVSWGDIKQATTKEEIIIYKNNTEVVALHKENGKTVKSAKATCCPEDKFDFNVGAKLAFNRLMFDDKVVVKKECFKNGDYVKIVSKTYNHFFPMGSIVRIEDYTNNNCIRCYGLIERRGKRSFEKQWLGIKDIEKIND